VRRKAFGGSFFWRSMTRGRCEVCAPAVVRFGVRAARIEVFMEDIDKQFSGGKLCWKVLNLMRARDVQEILAFDWAGADRVGVAGGVLGGRWRKDGIALGDSCIFRDGKTLQADRRI